MDEDLEPADEEAIEALLIALATQAGEIGDGSISRTVLDELARRHRSTVRTILGCAGHLIHYGADPEARWLTALRDQLTSALRGINDPPTDGILPGDVVELLVDRPQDHLVAGTPVTVRYVGTDGTTDVEPMDDYVIVTVPSETLACSEPLTFTTQVRRQTMDMFDRLALAYAGPLETRDDFRRFLTALFLDLEKHPERWADTDLSGFLSTMAWYAGDSLDASYRNTGSGEPPAEGSWRLIADLMMAARILDD